MAEEKPKVNEVAQGKVPGWFLCIRCHGTGREVTYGPDTPNGGMIMQHIPCTVCNGERIISRAEVGAP